MKQGRGGRWWALAALALSCLVVGLDVTVLNLALPTLSAALHASTSALQWFVVAYSLVFAAMLLPAGLLGDRFGRKRLLLMALGLFGLASLGCAFAPSSAALIGARAVLGLGAAFLIPLSMAVIPVIFSEGERPKAIAIWVACNAISFPIGPILGGWLLKNFWWGSVFLINVPVVLVALVAVAVLLPESHSQVRRRLDLGGAAISGIGLAGLIYGVIEAGDRGWGSTAALVPLAAGLLLLGVFVLWERRVTRSQSGRPIVDPTLFLSPSFTWGAVLATIVSFAMFGLLFAAPQYFQAVLGTDPLGSGLRLLPVIGGLFVGSQVAERIAHRAGAKVPVATGFVLLAAGLILAALTSVSSGYWFAAIWISVTGLGLGFALPTAMDAAMGALSTERSGAGSALIMTLRQVGGTIGVAILGTILASSYRSGLVVSGLPASAAGAARGSVSAGVAVATKLDSPSLLRSVQTAFVQGMDAMLWVCAGVALLGIVLTLALLPRWTATIAEKVPGEKETAAPISGGKAELGYEVTP